MKKNKSFLKERPLGEEKKGVWRVPSRQKDPEGKKKDLRRWVWRTNSNRPGNGHGGWRLPRLGKNLERIKKRKMGGPLK